MSVDVPFLLKIGKVINFDEFDYTPSDLAVSGEIDTEKVVVWSGELMRVVGEVLNEDVKFVYSGKKFCKGMLLFVEEESLYVP